MINGNNSSTGTRALILESAERRFARYGYSKVTMDEIAAEAGLKKASLYYYFPTKEELYHAVLDQEFAKFQKDVELIVAGDNAARERILAYVDSRYEFFNRLLHLNTMDYRLATRNKPALRAIFRRYAAQESRWLTSLFEEGQKRGEFGSVSPRKSAEAFLHLMQGLRARFMRDYEDGPVGPAIFSQFRRELLFITDIFLNGIAGRKAKRTVRGRAVKIPRAIR
jgi:TetR/AcrR family transcriptional regulator